MVLQVLSSLLVFFSLFQQAATPAPRQSFRISGTVVDALSGLPLAHAQVSVNAQAASDSTQVLTTGNDGRFVFENLAAGQYALSARRKGYAEQLYKQHEFFATAIIVAPGLVTSDLRFELRPDASVSGQVFDEMNEPVRHAQVMLLRQGLRFGRRTTWREGEVATDDQGRYHFVHLAPGTYFLSVTAQPWYAQHVASQRVERLVPSSGHITTGEITSGEAALDVVYPLTFFPNGTDISAAAPITLHAGDIATADITVHPTPALHLTFRSSSSNDSPQLSVQRVTQHIADGVEQGLPVEMTQVAPDTFEVVGLPPGRLNLGLVSSKGTETMMFSQTVQLAGDSEISAADLSVSATISGIIQMDDGSALSQRAYLRFHSVTTGATFEVQSEPNGEFQAQGIAPGIYGVTVLQPGASAVKSMSATGANVSGRTVEIVSGQDVRLTLVVSKGSAIVTGLALKDGKPADGVMIVLVPQNPEHNLVLFRRDQSDSDGSFNLLGILPGKYTIVAIENGWDLEWLSPRVLQKYLSGGEKLQINANAKMEVKVNVQL